LPTTTTTTLRRGRPLFWSVDDYISSQALQRRGDFLLQHCLVLTFGNAIAVDENVLGEICAAAQ
jgi:hypothetical protein